MQPRQKVWQFLSGVQEMALPSALRDLSTATDVGRGYRITFACQIYPLYPTLYNKTAVCRDVHSFSLFLARNMDCGNSIASNVIYV